MIIGRKSGFTIVELMLVIVVIGIISTITIVSYNGVQAKASSAEVADDTNKVADQLENYYINNNKFPDNLTQLGQISKGQNTVLAYQTSGTAYCLAASSTKSGTKTYTIRDDATLKEGNCSGWVAGGTLATPVASIGSILDPSFVVSWGSVSGATSYTVKYGVAAPTVTAGCSSSPCTISGLSSGTKYYVNVTASNSSSSATSSTISASTTYPGPTSISRCPIAQSIVPVGWPNISGVSQSHIVVPSLGINAIVNPYNGSLFVYDLGSGAMGNTVAVTVEYIKASGQYSKPVTVNIVSGGTDCS